MKFEILFILCIIWGSAICGRSRAKIDPNQVQTEAIKKDFEKIKEWLIPTKFDEKTLTFKDEFSRSVMRNFSSHEEMEYKTKLYAVGKYHNETSELNQFRFLEKTNLMSKMISKRLMDS